MAANILKFWLNEQKKLWKKKEKCKVYSNFSLLKTGVKKYQPNLSKDFIKQKIFGSSQINNLYSSKAECNFC